MASMFWFCTWLGPNALSSKQRWLKAITNKIEQMGLCWASWVGFCLAMQIKGTRVEYFLYATSGLRLLFFHCLEKVLVGFSMIVDYVLLYYVYFPYDGKNHLLIHLLPQGSMVESVWWVQNGLALKVFSTTHYGFFFAALSKDPELGTREQGAPIFWNLWSKAVIYNLNSYLTPNRWRLKDFQLLTSEST